MICQSVCDGPTVTPNTSVGSAINGGFLGDLDAGKLDPAWPAAVLKLQPNTWGALDERGNAYRGKGAYDQAISAYFTRLHGTELLPDGLLLLIYLGARVAKRLFILRHLLFGARKSFVGELAGSHGGLLTLLHDRFERLKEGRFEVKMEDQNQKKSGYSIHEQGGQRA